MQVEEAQGENWAGRRRWMIGSGLALVLAAVVAWPSGDDAGATGSIREQAAAADCPITLPHADPGFSVPDGYPQTPTSGVWYGTPGLWTALPADGDYQVRKSVWWSAGFPGGREEERPQISVTWERLDAGVVHTHAAPGTNAYTVQDGWFMIAGIDPGDGSRLDPGCWQVTATYKDASLSYVYFAP